MSRPLTIATVSAYPLILEHDTSNERMLQSLIDHWTDRIATVLPDRPDLIVLPEHCDRPWIQADPVVHFPIERIHEFTEFKKARMVDHLANISQAHHTYIAYSGYRLINGRLTNSTQLIAPSGDIAATYDKNYLTIAEHRDRGVEYGDRIPVFDTDIGRLAFLICFDLNFDEAIAPVAQQRPDMLIFSSAFHGGFLQQQWAYSTRSYLVASVYPPNPSGIVDPVGRTTATSTNYRHHAVTRINLDYAVIHIDRNMSALERAKRDLGPSLRIDDPGRVGTLLLTVESADLTVDDVIETYELELLDDYLDVSRQLRSQALAAGR